MRTSFDATADSLAGLKGWEVGIGLEVCIELAALKTKMFCGCSVEASSEPNAHTCPVCLGLPGALPAPNRAAIEVALLVGLATHCNIEKNVMLHRKHVMHPTVPNNYQIVQTLPSFCTKGYLDIEMPISEMTKNKPMTLDSGYDAKNDTLEASAGERIYPAEDKSVLRVGIESIQVEGDGAIAIPLSEKDDAEVGGAALAATHFLLDYNRAGVSLLKLATGPDLQTPEQACIFVRKLCEMYENLGFLKTSTKKDFLCCSAFVSLKPGGCAEKSAAVKLANIHSLDDLYNALVCEIRRQTEALEYGVEIKQEVRLWGADGKSVTVQGMSDYSERLHEYPDPDIAAFCLSDEYVEELRVRLQKQLTQSMKDM